MPDHKNTNNKTIKTTSDMESVADDYLNLWQENVKRWATDPDALEKWIKEVTSKITPPNKNTS